MSKPSIEKRIQKAKENAEKSLSGCFDESYNNVKIALSSALNFVNGKDGFNGEKIAYQIIDVDLDDNSGENLNQKPGECFFVEFTEDGYVVVVGAGYDYGRPQNDKYLNVKILNALNKEWSSRVILCFVTGLKKVVGRSGAGKAGCNHVLHCRNGIEMFIGEVLLEHGIPILNEYSHKNYKGLSEEEIKECVQEVF